MCMLPIERGPCMNYVERYYFDTSMGKCERFTYGGIIQPIQYLVLLLINITYINTKYPYNNKTFKSCFLTGCFGNDNNFESLEECESTCHSLIESAMNSKPVNINMGIWDQIKFVPINILV